MEGSSVGPDAVLMYTAPAGTFTVGVRESSTGHLWMWAESLRLPGTPHGLTFNVWGKTTYRAHDGSRVTYVDIARRSDELRCTQVQNSALARVVQDVYEAVQRDLPVLLAADLWMERKARLREIEAENIRLMDERIDLEEKLGVRPW